MKKSLLLTLCIVLTCTVSAQKYLGGDVSLLLTYEENGANYMDIDGKKITDLLAFLKDTATLGLTQNIRRCRKSL